MPKFLLLGLLFVSSLQAVEKVTITGTAGIADESEGSLTTTSIIRVGVFNNAISATTPLTVSEIGNMLNGTQAQVRANLDNLFATGKATLWGSTTVNTVFNGAATASLTKTSTTVFGGNPIYVLVFNSTSITTATQVGIFVYNDGVSPLVFPAIGVGSVASVDLEFDGNDFDGPNMRPCLGSIGSDGNYRLAAIGNGYGIISSLTASCARNNPFIYIVRANNGAISFNATGLPAGLSINTTTGEISGTPSAAAGNYNIQLAATGPLGTRTSTLVLTLNPSGSSPAISSSLANQLTVAGVAYSGYSITGDNSPTSFSATGLPAGLSCDANNGMISGIPNQTGTFNVTIRATNGNGTGSASFTLTVTAPTITSSLANQSTVAGVAYAGYTITANNSPTSYSVSGLPAGLSCDTNSGIISGVPIQTGTFNVTIRATNINATQSASFTLIVTNPVLSFIDKNLETNVLGATTAPTVTPGFVPEYYFISSGVIPEGLSIASATGIISGSPTTSGTTSLRIGAYANGVNAFGDIVITVKQTQFSLTVLYDVLRGTVNISPYATNYNIGSTVQIQATALPGYVFQTWSGDVSVYSAGIMLNMDRDKNIRAVFAEDTADTDNDGISNYQEYILYGTNPNTKDSNNDGIEDGRAVSLGYDPKINFLPLINNIKASPPNGLYNESQYQANRINGQNDGISVGVTQGIAQVTNAPNSFGLFTLTQYMINRAAGQSEGVALVTGSPRTYNLYQASDIQDMSIGGLVLRKAADNTFTLNYDIEQSEDLQAWRPYQTFTLPITNLPSNKTFIRFKAKQ